MQTVQLNKQHKLQLPEDWTEMSIDDRLKAADWLLEVQQGKMSMFEWQLQMLWLLTGYRPSRATRRAIKNGGSVPMIEYNLIKLAELIDFPFEPVEEQDEQAEQAIERSTKQTHWRISHQFWNAPFPCSLNFDRTEAYIKTNLTAEQFVSLVEALNAIENIDTTQDIETLSLQIRLLMAEMLKVLGTDERYAFKVIKGEWEEVDGVRQPKCVLNMAVANLMHHWAISIVDYFFSHERYGIIYRLRDGKVHNIAAEGTKHGPYSSSHIEVLFELEQQGMQNVRQMPIEEFMEAQLKLLRDRVRELLSHGMKPQEIAQRTGLPAEFIG